MSFEEFYEMGFVIIFIDVIISQPLQNRSADGSGSVFAHTLPELVEVDHRVDHNPVGL